jgi:hypothetical protein
VRRRKTHGKEATFAVRLNLDARQTFSKKIKKSQSPCLAGLGWNACTLITAYTDKKEETITSHIT